ncbi:MAG: FecR domain-containing protein, partial [Bacteroidota bacterium]
MKRKTVLLAIVVLSALIISPAWRVPQDKRDIAAYLIKVVKDVQKKSPAAGWQQAVPLDVLKSGHQVRTDEKSFALIRFADETKLLLREKTVAEIKGQIEGKQILDRNVHTTRGNVGFDVKKQEKEAFRFSSPISVASIRGTTGYFEHQDDQLIDLFGISKGLGTLTNLISDQSVDVSDNQTGVSNGQGNLDVRNSTPGELLLSGANFPTDDELAVPGEPRQHELRFSAQD